MKELFIVLSLIWSVFSLVGIVDMLIYKRCKRTPQATILNSAFQHFYVFKLHRWLDYILHIGGVIIGVIWCMIVLLYAIMK